ncbi:MAG: hypothetical protein CVV27_13000 [Candidatus Melainabacteria bacterium HGW-Melainabacteria-1]|nr:MAG: hypothetical protein CVV27_13000 [Candidatus Melainabacteria bacterium HGW-Melainabacteria-1]
MIPLEALQKEILALRQQEQALLDAYARRLLEASYRYGTEVQILRAGQPSANVYQVQRAEVVHATVDQRLPEVIYHLANPEQRSLPYQSFRADELVPLHDGK